MNPSLDTLTKMITIIIAIGGVAGILFTAQANEEEIKDLKPRVQENETQNRLHTKDIQHIKKAADAGVALARSNQMILQRIEQKVDNQ
jgi:imidazolonepropionase-like amidohydrolase